MIRAIVFDLGRVLIDFDFNIAIERLKKRAPVNPIKLLTFFSAHSPAVDFDRGVLGEREFFSAIQKEMNLPLSMEEFIVLWNEIFTEKKAMADWAKSLKGKYKIGILSNTNPWHLQHLKKKHGWVFEFDAFVGSCEVQMMKPNPRIYRHILEKLGVAPEETFYVDDIAENVAAAKNLGMDAVQFKDEASFFIEVYLKRYVLSFQV
jgi:putative hydrolase of the HAD superfamily